MFWRIIWQNLKSIFKNTILLLGIYSTEILVYVSKKKFLKAVIIILIIKGKKPLWIAYMPINRIMVKQIIL